jgi:catechol 2,3-dioxygenase-like lactoylglutathione lyase family enzyme
MLDGTLLHIARLKGGPVAATLTHACVITGNVARLRDFYGQVLQIAPSADRAEYVEFAFKGSALSFYDANSFQEYAEDAAMPGRNRSVMIEFRVDDVDAEYERLQQLQIEWVKPPSTQPWGNRSIYFRDPDGNLINVYMRVARDG